MMSGLRSQCESTMTWVSLRSGMASTGRWVMAHTPHAQAAPTKAKTRNLFRTEAPMIRLIIEAPRPARGNGHATAPVASILRGILLKLSLAFFRTERERLAFIFRSVLAVPRALGVQLHATSRITAGSDFSVGVVRNNSC